MYIEDMLGTKKIIIGCIMFLLVITVIGLMITKNLFLLEKGKKYSLYNENKKLNVTIFTRQNPKENSTREYFFIFPNENNFIVLVPEKKIIGVSNQKYFMKIFGKTYLNTSAYKFTPVNVGYFLDEGPIKSTFKKNRIEFNSFMTFKKYGQRFVLKKQVR